MPTTTTSLAVLVAFGDFVGNAREGAVCGRGCEDDGFVGHKKTNCRCLGSEPFVICKTFRVTAIPGYRCRSGALCAISTGA